MTGETVSDLLRPLIGKTGTIFMVVGKVVAVGWNSDAEQTTGQFL